MHAAVLKRVCLGLLLSLASAAFAHPHNWIILKSEFILDEQGRLTDIRQEWEFDLFYSSISLADLMNEHGNEKIGLKFLAEDMITNLESHSYFSRLIVDDKNIPIPVPNEYALSTINFEDQKLIKLDMNFKLETPLPLENKSLAWQVFDPTYYIDMSHRTEKQVLISSKNATECEKHIEFADPSDEMIEYASSLDRTQRNTDGLGILFAEKITLNCI